MKIFKWRREEEVADEETQAQVDFLQSENDNLLDQVESLKLDVSELQEQNQRLTDKINRSKFQRMMIKTGIGLGILIVTYIVLMLVDTSPDHIIWLLIIESAFMILMLRGDEK
ncbi:hypothetical protein PUF88_06420 [Lactobacillaceae bacterium L1_55_11]|nr:hypothetical protein [Lactobacillaceae bacterium L1_55_11]